VASYADMYACACMSCPCVTSISRLLCAMSQIGRMCLCLLLILRGSNKKRERISGCTLLKDVQIKCIIATLAFSVQFFFSHLPFDLLVSIWMVSVVSFSSVERYKWVNIERGTTRFEPSSAHQFFFCSKKRQLGVTDFMTCPEGVLVHK
jgi:hypothetical protein